MEPRLKTLIRSMGVPRSYFHGRTHSESFVPNNILMFRRTTWADLRRATFEMRPHHRYVLIFNLATLGSVRIDRAEVELRPGEGLLILPYQFHLFPKTRREDILWLIITFECDRPSLLEQFRGKVFSFGAPVMRRLLSLAKLFRSEDEEWLNQILAFELACLVAQLQPLVREPKMLPIVADGRARQLLDDIEGYLRNSHPVITSIQEVAKYLRLSESRLRSRFRAAFGSSLGAYLRNYRLHVVIEHLRDTRRNFTQIANDLGFPDSATLTRFVRSQTGYTPSEFRRSLIT